VLLEISCNDRRIALEITVSAGVRKVTLDGVETPCDWVRLPDGHYSLILDGQVHDFIVDFSESVCTVTGREGTHSLHISDARHPAPRNDVQGGQSGLQKLKADMPGKVIRVLVKEGDSVAHDQALLVLEAMKMQNEIRAPKSGIVTEIGITAGKTVNTGDFLLTIE
jgi:biotin carboxyl carrier protein